MTTETAETLAPEDARLVAEALQLPQSNEEGSGAPGDPGTDTATDEVSGRVDEELDGARSDEERAEIRERRRQERETRKQRARERDAAQKRQIDQLTGQVDALRAQVLQASNGFVGMQVHQLQQQRAQANNASKHFEALYATAVSAGDGEAAASAMRNMQNAQRAEASLEMQLREADRALRAAPSANPGGAPTPQLNQDMVKKGSAFMAANPWFKGHKSTEPDSAVLSALDSSLANEGWDPATDEYWTELEARAKRYLPHRFTGQAPAAQPGYNSGTGGPHRQTTVGSGGNSSGGPSQGNFQLSAARVQAMKEAGYWDDPVKRKRAIENYRAYDATNRK